MRYDKMTKFPQVPGALILSIPRPQGPESVTESNSTRCTKLLPNCARRSGNRLAHFYDRVNITRHKNMTLVYIRISEHLRLLQGILRINLIKQVVIDLINQVV